MSPTPASRRPEPGRAVVGLVRCRSYRPEEVAEAVGRLLAGLEPLSLPRGGRVLLKPNCLSHSHSPEEGVNTRAEVVEAVGRYLQERHGLDLVIADSAGAGSRGRTAQAFEKIGLTGVAERLGAELVSLDQGPGLMELESPLGLEIERFQATALLGRVEAVINLPKMKTHLLTGLTSAVKNCLGLLPGGLKRSLHVAAPTGPQLSRALVDLYAAVRPSLNVLDAVVAMEGAGPSQGRPRPAGWLAASADGVALDLVAATMMGFDPNSVETIRAAAAAGLGQGNRDGIDLQGAEWAELPLAGFKRPWSRAPGWLGRVLPRRLTARVLDWYTEARPRLRPENCQLCGACVEACPAGALSLRDGRLDFEAGRCIECYCCLEQCPSQGLWVPLGLRDKLLGRPRS